MINYLNGGNKNYLTLSADDLKVIKWYVDASFEVLPDFNSHTGVILTMGQGFMQSVPRKHKLNMSIIQEAGLVAVGYTSVYILWKVLFIEWQGYNIDKNILYQDNESSIMLEVDSKRISGKRIQALSIRLIVMKYKVLKENVHIKYCPTDKMWGYFMTKPMQRSNFRNFKNSVLGGNE